MDGSREYSKSIPDEEIIQDAYALFKEIQDYEAVTRREMRDDVQFENGKVWNESDVLARQQDDMPSLNVPRMDQFLNHIRNGFRQSKPAIKVSAKGADSEEVEEKRIKYAERRQGLTRAIQYASSAVDAYQEIFDEASTKSGRGFIHITTQYVSDNSFDQEIVVDNIDDPFRVYMDRGRSKRDYRDAKYGFILSDMPREVFKAKYPDASDAHWFAEGDGKWIGKDDVTVAQFYCTWVKKRTLFMLEDGRRGYTDELDELTDGEKELVRSQIVKTREVREPYIMWYKLTTAQILDRRHIPGRWIPIVAMVGTEQEVDGVCNIYSMVRKLKDSAMLYNYAASQEAKRLSLSPKVPFIAAEGQIAGLEKEWAEANISNKPVLPYKPVTVGQHLAPPPQRQPPIGIDAGLINAKQGYLDDMRSIASIDMPSLGMMGPERSGIALKELKRGADIANLHYLDNMRITITHVGRIIQDWLPVYYDTDRIVKILGEEMDEKELRINAPDEDGEDVLLGDGEFDVTVTMGQSHDTKRQESMEFMLELIRAAPQVTPLIYDLLVKNMDSPGAQEISERLKRTIPPEILEEKGGEKQMQMQLQQAVQRLQQDEQIIQVLTAKLEEAMKELEDNGKEIAKDIEVARINQEGKIAVEHIKATAQQAQDTRRIAADYWKSFQESRNSTRSE